MSHSSLSAQLASLHSKNNGISSRQHNDAIGRGIHHSSKAGHTILNNSVKNKPSVLYPDSRAAANADVPFTTLRENAVASLQFLSQHCSKLFDMNQGEYNVIWKTLLGPKSVKYERGLNTKETNAKFDAMIKDALYLLSSAWGDSVYSINVSSSTFIQLGANKPSSVLHVLEYLVQKYYVHVHNAEGLLVAFLPHHETFLFDRILQLIDVAQFPHWSFLRPFSTTKGIKGVPRTTFAKWAASTKDNGGGIVIVKKIADIAKKSAKIHCQERKLVGSYYGVRQGISIALSFSAATIAETLHIQHAAKGTIDEALLRTLVPVIFSSVEPLSNTTNWSMGALCPEWRAFGRILISLLLEKCELSADLNDALVVAVVKGCIESIQLLIHDEKEVEGEEYEKTKKFKEVEMKEMSLTLQQSILETTSDAILTIMTISHTLQNVPNATDVKSVKSVLPICGNKHKEKRQIVGYNMSTKIFRAVLQVPYLSLTMGHLYAEKDIDIRPLLASLCAMSISNMNCKPKDYQISTNHIMQLTVEPSLRNAWIDDETQLIASMSSAIVDYGSKVNSLKAEMKTVVQASLAKLLKSMKMIKSSSCDVGVTNAVTYSTADLDSKEERENMIRELLQLSGHLNKEATPSGKRDKKNIGRDLNDLDSNLLPPMMALEHPDQNIRIQALSNLEKSCGNQSDVNDIASALLRRFVSDDDPIVATKSVETLSSLHVGKNLSDSFFIQDEVVENVIFGVKKWTRISNQSPTMDENSVNVLCACMNLAALCSQGIIKSCNFNQLTMDDIQEKNIFNLMSLISQYTFSQDGKGMQDRKETVAEHSIQSLLQALGECGAKSSRRNNKSSLQAICENEHFQNIVNNCIDNKHATEESKQFLCFFLRVWNESASSSKTSKIRNDTVVAAAISILSMAKEGDETNSDLELVKHILNQCIAPENMESSINIALSMASLTASGIYQEIGVPVIKSLYDERKKVSPKSSMFFILEAMTRSMSTSTSTERLIKLVDEFLSSPENIDKESCTLVFLSSLSMFGHVEVVVRECALALYSKSGRALAQKDQKVKAMKIPCMSNSSLKSTILMDGSNSLPQILRKIIKNCDDGKSASTFLLNACNNMAQQGLSLVQVSNGYCGDGFCHAASIVLSAMETAGERYFPLSNRWKIAGKELYDFYLQKWPRIKSTSLATRTLLETVVVMMKGVTIVGDNIDEGVVITNHVSGTGRRSRSYSVGTIEGISCIHPYPSDMTKAILSFLDMCSIAEMTNFLLEAFDVMMNLVLMRTSWVNGIFKQADKRTRKNIAKKLLTLRSKRHLEPAAIVLIGLNLDAAEILHLFASESFVGGDDISSSLLALTVLTDCIRQQPESLGNSNDLVKLFSTLFDHLAALSNSETSVFNDSCDYTRCSIIQALLPLSMKLTLKKKDKIDIGDHAKLLVDLLKDKSDDCNISPLMSGKSKSLALDLLTNLCALSPSTIVGSLVPAMINSIDFDGYSDHSNFSESAMIAIIPAYCQHAPAAGLTLTDLLAAFINHCKSVQGKSWHQKLSLYSHLAKGLMLHAKSDGVAMAAVVTYYLASEATNKNDKTKDSNEVFTMKLLEQINAPEQISCSLKILCCLNIILPMLTDPSFKMNDQEQQRNMIWNENDFFSISARDLYSMIFDGQQITTPTHDNLSRLLWFIATILNVLQRNIFSLPSVKGSIKRSGDDQAKICLKIWQELTHLQSHLLHAKHEETDHSSKLSKTYAWKSMEEDTANILTTIQMMLPAPHFLASVSSLLNDDGTGTDIKRGAIQLLADRSSEVEVSSPEATLFLEMITDLVNIVTVKTNSYESSILRQTSFRAIEQLNKNLGLSLNDDKLRQKRSVLFTPAFQAVTNFLRQESASEFVTKASDKMASGHILSFPLQSQVLGSALLCAASLISMLKAKCVSQLQSLLKPVILILSASNMSLRINNTSNIGPIHQSIKLIQLATLRTLVAIAETIPQFLTPYIDIILAPNCLASIKMNYDSTDEGVAVMNMSDRLENAIATRSPVHLLVPRLSKSMKSCFSHGHVADSIMQAILILKLLKTSIAQSSRSTLSPLIGKLVNALLQAYSYDCSTDDRTELLKQANETLLSLVMKLSESQLRPLYARLREWRGDFDSSSENKKLVGSKRFAFWSLSAAISLKLKNIFLPCMSSIVGDMVKELEYAASQMCSSTIKTIGNKRQKTSSPIVEMDADSLTSLQPLLLCLESALKADAHEGGNWIRSEDGQRYRMLLEPLGKLLNANIPKSLSITHDLQDDLSTKYEMLVEGVGTEEHGNVSQTLTALAAAAGNEILWKPLNHCLLEACGHERRIEVRKAGVKTLLNIIQTLGEEYMVLLPECLPVLSELLEDEDESIILLAKECVRQGEELLGESLEESLR